jgi:hypothetical protein
MPDTRTASDILSTLAVCGAMGMVGQGARTIVGLKKLSDFSGVSPSQSEFVASRIFIGLMIGFVAGVAAGLALKVFDSNTFDVSLLMGLAAAGYAGTDVIEGFTQTLGATRLPQQVSTSIREPKSTPETKQPQKPQPRIPSLNGELQAAKSYGPLIDDSAKKYGIEPSLIYGIGSRESAWGLALHPPGSAGTGDKVPRKGPEPLPPDGQGWGRGLMQIDYGAHEFARTGDWQDASANIDYGCGVLASELSFFKTTVDDANEALRAGIAAYNCGRTNVLKALHSGVDVDLYTTEHDYSTDVARRANWFKSKLIQDTSAV